LDERDAVVPARGGGTRGAPGVGTTMKLPIQPTPREHETVQHAAVLAPRPSG